MGDSSRQHRDGLREELPTASKALSHPTRVRILEVVNEQDMSPIQFVNSDLAPDIPGEEDLQARLAHVAYHFRELKKSGCVVVIKTAQRRGATEHVYRGAARAHFTDAEWAKLEQGTRERISRTILQGLIARAESAMIAGTFDSSPNRHLSWIPAKRLDEGGWNELALTLERTFGDVEQIRRDSEQRLKESGGEGIAATVGLLLFESPPSQPGASLSYEGDALPGIDTNPTD